MDVFILIMGIISLIVGVVFAILKATKSVRFKKSWVFITCGILAITLGSSFQIIPTGYTGVRTTFGQIDDATVQNGFNWKIPFVQSIANVNNKQQDIKFEDEEIWSETQERTALFYTGITVTYQINPEKSAWIYANISDYENNLVSKSLVSSSVKASSKTLSDTDATDRAIIEPLVCQNLQKSLDDKYGKDVILVNKVIINNADFEDSYNEAVAAKQLALKLFFNTQNKQLKLFNERRNYFEIQSFKQNFSNCFNTHYINISLFCFRICRISRKRNSRKSTLSCN